MTKDSYTPIRLMSNAVEHITTEVECCSTLIPAKAVKIQTCDIEIAPKRSCNFILIISFFVQNYDLNLF
jgi:hypothetical protein